MPQLDRNTASSVIALDDTQIVTVCARDKVVHAARLGPLRRFASKYRIEASIDN